MVETIDDMEDVLFEGSRAQISGLSSCGVSPVSYSMSGDSMTIRFGNSESHLDGIHETPNCVGFFGDSHDFSKATAPVE